MSRMTKIDIEIKNYDQSKYQAICDALNEEWEFEGFETYTATDQDPSGIKTMAGSGTESLAGGDARMLLVLRKTVWKANGQYCDVVVHFTDLEASPHEAFSSSKLDYDVLKLSGELDE